MGTKCFVNNPPTEPSASQTVRPDGEAAPRGRYEHGAPDLGSVPVTVFGIFLVPRSKYTLVVRLKKLIERIH